MIREPQSMSFTVRLEHKRQLIFGRYIYISIHSKTIMMLKIQKIILAKSLPVLWYNTNDTEAQNEENEILYEGNLVSNRNFDTSLSGKSSITKSVSGRNLDSSCVCSGSFFSGYAYTRLSVWHYFLTCQCTCSKLCIYISLFQI